MKISENLNIFAKVGKFIGTKLPECDQFPASDFFKADDGLCLRDVNVYAKVGDSPELREKLRDYMKVTDVSQVDEKDLEVRSSNDSFSTILEKIDSRISELERQAVQATTE